MELPTAKVLLWVLPEKGVVNVAALTLLWCFFLLQRRSGRPI